MVPAGDPTAPDRGRARPSCSARATWSSTAATPSSPTTASNADLLAKKGIGYLDCGVSGGIWGLSNGYGLMVGGARRARRSARCRSSTRCGPRARAKRASCTPATVGAGHYAKMVHNGIEYGLMQAYAEGYELLAAQGHRQGRARRASRPGPRGTVVRSWLLDLLVKALERGPGPRRDQRLRRRLRRGPLDGRGGHRQRRADAGRSRPRSSPGSSRGRTTRPAMKAVAALRNQFGGHAVKAAEATGRTDLAGLDRSRPSR